MLAMGSLLFGAGVLLVGLLALLFGNPRAPRWTRPELVAMLAVIPVTVMLALGLGYVMLGSYRLLQGVGHLYELAVSLGVALAVAGSWRGLGVGRRLAAYGPVCAPAGVAVGPGLAVVADQPPPPPPPRRPAHGPTRKAA